MASSLPSLKGSLAEAEAEAAEAVASMNSSVGNQLSSKSMDYGLKVGASANRAAPAAAPASNDNQASSPKNSKLSISSITNNANAAIQMSGAYSTDGIRRPSMANLLEASGIATTKPDAAVGKYQSSLPAFSKSPSPEIDVHGTGLASHSRSPSNSFSQANNISSLLQPTRSSQSPTQSYSQINSYSAKPASKGRTKSAGEGNSANTQNYPYQSKKHSVAFEVIPYNIGESEPKQSNVRGELHEKGSIYGSGKKASIDESGNFNISTINKYNQVFSSSDMSYNGSSIGTSMASGPSAFNTGPTTTFRSLQHLQLPKLPPNRSEALSQMIISDLRSGNFEKNNEEQLQSNNSSKSLENDNNSGLKEPKKSNKSTTPSKARAPRKGQSDVPRPYACTYQGCEWSFTRISDQRRHLKSHEMPMFHCPYWSSDPTCHRNGGSFNRLDVLKRHLRLVHFVQFKQSESGWCRTCEKMFTTPRHFLEHCGKCAYAANPENAAAEAANNGSSSGNSIDIERPSKRKHLGEGVVHPNGVVKPKVLRTRVKKQHNAEIAAKEAEASAQAIASAGVKGSTSTLSAFTMRETFKSLLSKKDRIEIIQESGRGYAGQQQSGGSSSNNSINIVVENPGGGLNLDNSPLIKKSTEKKRLLYNLGAATTSITNSVGVTTNNGNNEDSLNGEPAEEEGSSIAKFIHFEGQDPTVVNTDTSDLRSLRLREDEISLKDLKNMFVNSRQSVSASSSLSSDQTTAPALSGLIESGTAPEQQLMLEHMQKEGEMDDVNVVTTGIDSIARPLLFQMEDQTSKPGKRNDILKEAIELDEGVVVKKKRFNDMINTSTLDQSRVSTRNLSPNQTRISNIVATGFNNGDNNNDGSSLLVDHNNNNNDEDDDNNNNNPNTDAAASEVPTTSILQQQLQVTDENDLENGNNGEMAAASTFGSTVVGTSKRPHVKIAGGQRPRRGGSNRQTLSGTTQAGHHVSRNKY